MIESWKESLDQGGHYGALLTDLSKAFCYIMHNLSIAKLKAYGFDNELLFRTLFVIFCQAINIESKLTRILAHGQKQNLMYPMDS